MYFHFEFLGRFLHFETGGVEENSEEMEEDYEEPTPEPINAGHPISTYVEMTDDPIGFHMPPEPCY